MSHSSHYYNEQPQIPVKRKQVLNTDNENFNKLHFQKRQT